MGYHRVQRINWFSDKFYRLWWLRHRAYSRIAEGMPVLIGSNCRLDAAWSHPWKGSRWRTAYIRLTCGRVYRNLSWLLIDVGGLNLTLCNQPFHSLAPELCKNEENWPCIKPSKWARVRVFLLHLQTVSNDASGSCLDSPEVMNSNPKLETASNLSALTCFLSGYFIPVMEI